MSQLGRTLTLGSTFAVLLLSSVATASSDRFGSRGTLELSGTFGLNLEAGFGELVTLTSHPTIGFFVAKGVELSLSPGVVLSTDFDQTDLSLLLLAGPSYNVDLDGPVFPFMGLVGGITKGGTAWIGPIELAASGSGTIDDVTPVVGGEFGVKIQIGEAGLLRPQLQVLVIPFSGQTVVHLAAQFGAGVFF